ncbi:MAG: hypothetical protein RRB13_11875 [bacterium]|nr:hypothetical protein [bacterium]
MTLQLSTIQSAAQANVLENLNANLAANSQLDALTPEGAALVDGITQAITEQILSSAVVIGTCPPGTLGGPLTGGQVT